ncbi:hypothetical protein [Bathymodiolus platifrons methanotrophic gill symbiont]|uniref:hypothetical protein n=1 Tax=Bathymodiolus platifrons methanotrophic gill symbiont TaxID=113268 RepID=UPI001C8D5E6D|nr:hypothetical protein [Bathymodiolus platifrons methanotrophic gill symbiont]
MLVTGVPECCEVAWRACIVPFTSSMTSNLWRCLDTLFGFEIKNKRFYTFMASPTLPWAGLWQTIWGLIPSPETDGRILVGFDDSIITKVGKKIFGCEAIFDHAAKSNQSKYHGHKILYRWGC